MFNIALGAGRAAHSGWYQRPPEPTGWPCQLSVSDTRHPAQHIRGAVRTFRRTQSDGPKESAHHRAAAASPACRQGAGERALSMPQHNGQPWQGVQLPPLPPPPPLPGCPTLPPTTAAPGLCLQEKQSQRVLLLCYVAIPLAICAFLLGCGGMAVLMGGSGLPACRFQQKLLGGAWHGKLGAAHSCRCWVCCPAAMRSHLHSL